MSDVNAAGHEAVQASGNKISGNIVSEEQVTEKQSSEDHAPEKKKNIFKRIFHALGRPFRFIKRKTEPALEFMKKGQAGAIIADLLVSALFMTWIVRGYIFDRYPWILMFVLTAVILAAVTELISLLIKLVFAGGKRCRSYFILVVACVALNNISIDQGEAAGGGMLMSFALALATDITGRIVCAFIRTKRFKQVTAYVLTVLCLAYYCFYAFFFFNDSFGDRRIEHYTSMNTSAAVTEQVKGFDAYLQNGSYKVASLSYGPDSTDDIMTDTLDFTVFDSVENREGFYAFTDMFSNYDFSKVPVKGQIWYPEGQKDCPVFFIVHGNHDSYVPSYLGYEYLSEYLASNGYVVISVDENIINATGEGNDKRAILLLENMKTLMGLNAKEGNPLSGLMDPLKIAIGGHSRGGEMVAAAYLFNGLDAYPEDGNIRFDYHFNITSIVAIAPVVDQYRPAGYSVGIEDVNYLLIHGSNDQDVSSMMGEKQYNNITFTGNEFRFKSSVYILGANHGQFNQLWGRYDTGDTSPHGYLNTYNFIDEKDQKVIAMGYIRSFLDTTLGLGDTYASLMYDVDGYRSFLPETVYVTNYSDSNFVTLASFEDTVDIVNNGRVSVNVTGASTWNIGTYDRGNGMEGEDHVLYLEWMEDEVEPGSEGAGEEVPAGSAGAVGPEGSGVPDGTAPSAEFSFEAADLTDTVITFGICDYTETEAEDFEGGLDYTVTLTDSAGHTVSAKCPDFVYRTLAVQLYKQDVLFGTYEYKHQMQTVSVMNSDFGDASGFDFTSVTGLTITINGGSEGRLIIDDICFCPAV